MLLLIKARNHRTTSGGIKQCIVCNFSCLCIALFQSQPQAKGINDLSSMNWMRLETVNIPEHVVAKFAMRGCISVVLSFAGQRTGNVSAIGTIKDVQRCVAPDFCRLQKTSSTKHFPVSTVFTHYHRVYSAFSSLIH